MVGWIPTMICEFYFGMLIKDSTPSHDTVFRNLSIVDFKWAIVKTLSERVEKNVAFSLTFVFDVNNICCHFTVNRSTMMWLEE